MHSNPARTHTAQPFKVTQYTAQHNTVYENRLSIECRWVSHYTLDVLASISLVLSVGFPPLGTLLCDCLLFLLTAHTPTARAMTAATATYAASDVPRMSPRFLPPLLSLSSSSSPPVSDWEKKLCWLFLLVYKYGLSCRTGKGNGSHDHCLQAVEIVAGSEIML